jgi:cyclopropane fatty-acyl-phospholipid synthase-like methyltransferase
LARVLDEWEIAGGECLELGCGTGTNAIYLAGRNFRVTATDLSALAIEQAKEKAAAAGVQIRFFVSDLLQNPDLGGPYPFVFDRGVYHVLRLENLPLYREILARDTAPGGMYLTLVGNANDPAPADRGPPRVKASELATELEPYFQLIQLREFRFDGVVVEGAPAEPLAWSALFRRV